MMLKLIVHYIKLLLILVSDLIHRFKKYSMYILFGKHEFERICESSCDIYEKTMKLDQWLMRTNCEKIRDFWEQNIYYKSISPDCLPMQTIEKILSCYEGNFNTRTQITRNKTKPSPDGVSKPIVNLEDGDILLIETLEIVTDRFIKVIKRSKKTKLNAKSECILRDAIYRIISYNLSLVVLLKLASTPYDSSTSSHIVKLMNLWNNLVKSDKLLSSQATGSNAFPVEICSEITDANAVISSRWSHIGFQGEDPGTDFRGMGLLGLEQLEYLSRRSKNLALDLLKRSLNEEHEYPFAIVGINITYNLVNLFKENCVKHLYYDCGDVIFRNKQRNLNLIKTFNDLYIELFLRFDCFWHESKPENIFAFRELMEKFISVIKFDLCNRTFSFKFIY